MNVSMPTGGLRKAAPLFLASSIALIGHGPASADESSPDASHTAAIAAALEYFERYPSRRAQLIPLDVSKPNAPVESSYALAGSDSGERVPVMLNSARTGLVETGFGLLAGYDRENLTTIYARVFKLLPADLAAELIDPSAFETLGLAEQRGRLVQQYDLVANNIDTITDLNSTLGLPGGVNPIGDCALEIGYEDGGPDGENPTRCDLAEYESTGIVGNLDFPLKDNLTCIKDQGRRGTCVAHAIAATAESLEMVDSGLAFNFSEQDLYFEAETETGNNILDPYLEGLYTSETIAHLDSSGYNLQLEEDWNYNRSPNRASPVVLGVAPVGLVPTYTDSCSSDYWGERCTDFASQGITTFSSAFNGTALRPSMPAGVDSIHSSGVFPMDPLFATPSLNVVKSLLSADMPIVLSTAVSLRFTTPLRGGYVTYLASSSVTGNHAVTLVGYVDNADLPAGAPPATEDGYFIAKNSWGKRSADCGFVYLDQAYVRNRANYMSFFSL